MVHLRLPGKRSLLIFLFNNSCFSCSSLVEEIEQMNSLFQQKQRELVLAVSKVEELTRQLEMLKNGRIDGHHDNQSAVAELDRLYKELQVSSGLLWHFSGTSSPAPQHCPHTGQEVLDFHLFSLKGWGWGGRPKLHRIQNKLYDNLRQETWGLHCDHSWWSNASF